MRLKSLLPLFVGPWLVLGSRVAVAQQGALPWQDPEPAPAVAGLELGASRAYADSLLGKPDSVEDVGDGAQRLTYAAHCMDLVYRPAEGLQGIHLCRRQWGDIGGVRVGDTRESVVARWGMPEPDLDQGFRYVYVVGTWGILVEFDASRTLVADLEIRTLPPGR
jgi:hypothetical protein